MCVPHTDRKRSIQTAAKDGGRWFESESGRKLDQMPPKRLKERSYGGGRNLFEVSPAFGGGVL